MITNIDSRQKYHGGNQLWYFVFLSPLPGHLLWSLDVVDYETWYPKQHDSIKTSFVCISKRHIVQTETCNTWLPYLSSAGPYSFKCTLHFAKIFCSFKEHRLRMCVVYRNNGWHLKWIFFNISMWFMSDITIALLYWETWLNARTKKFIY